MISSVKANKIINKILAEEISIVPHGNRLPQQIYAGNVQYNITGKYSNYGLIVFNDCNQFDYIDSIVSSDFTMCVFDFSTISSIDRFKISEEKAWEIFRIPGYLKFRCEACGTFISSKDDNKDAFYCSNLNCFLSRVKD